MEHYINAAKLGASAIVILMSVMWVFSVTKKDASLVDRIWGIGFFIAYAAYLYAASSMGVAQYLVAAGVLIWGGRLSLHIHLRNRGHSEDKRYQEFRNNDPKHFWWKSYLKVFLLQGFLMWFISLPLLVIAVSPQSDLSIWHMPGILLWCVGFYFECVGDSQLKRFKANPANKGRVLKTGLWARTRHPNYFGDACLWWGFWVYSLTCDYGIYTVLSPLTMSIFLRFVSGVTLLEKSMKNKSAEYVAYVKDTPAFFPRIILRKDR